MYRGKRFPFYLNPETMRTKTLTRNLQGIEVSTITLESGEVATAIFTMDGQEVLFSLSGGCNFKDQQIERTSKGWSKAKIHSTWTKAAGNRILIPDREIRGSFRLIER